MTPFELFVDMEYERRLRKEIMKNEGIKNYFHYWNKNYICRIHNNIGDIEKVIDNIDYMHSYQSRNEKINSMANTSPNLGPEFLHFIALVNADIPTEDEVYNENIQPLKEKIKTWKELRGAIIVKIKYERMKLKAVNINNNVGSDKPKPELTKEECENELLSYLGKGRQEMIEKRTNNEYWLAERTTASKLVDAIVIHVSEKKLTYPIGEKQIREFTGRMREPDGINTVAKMMGTYYSKLKKQSK